MRSAALSNIHVSGGLFSEHFIRLMKEERSSFVYALPETFVTPTDENEKPPTQRGYDLNVAQVWADLKERWDTYGHKLARLEPADARRVWTMPLLEALEFEPEALRKHGQVSDRLTFKFSHKGWGINPRYHNPPITHIVPPGQGLDSRLERGTPSPHDALQQYLNMHDDSWALLTNGLYLRVLRDYHHTYVKGYIEFDLEAIFLTRSFRDFQALYRVAHASRFTPADTESLFLEEYFQHSQLVGEKVGAKLRENVVTAVIALGNGFLNDQLLAELRADERKCHEFYEEILRVIYRIIFLLYAEQRGMFSGGEATHHDLYLEEYSMSALRERALSDYSRGDRHTDHWEGLRSTFEMLRRGSPEFGIYPYGGMLFDTSNDDYINQYACKNSELLEAVYYLTTTELDGAIHRISYADIDVEEIGAIYESLLENIPRITEAPESINKIEYPANSFILDPRALTRKTTGSYYTQQALIQELIKSALEPVVSNRLHSAGDQQAQEEALLSIKICDPACGSGAFLIAACNHLGERLARIRSSNSILTEDLVQQARREVLQHCIYGVDLNPMALELVKVSLWINALVRDRPLNFLDHHLKCGNSLIGTMPDLIERGILTDAFDPVEGDDETAASEAKKLNRIQLSNISLSHWEHEDYTRALCSDKFALLSEHIERNAKDVEEKSNDYCELIESDAFADAKILADVWTSSFFWPLRPSERQSDIKYVEDDLPTQRTLNTIAEQGQSTCSSAFVRRIEKLTQQYSFFHWYLEFPEIFGREDPGFDCVLGNPPWERIKVQEKEFFQQKAPTIANAKNAAQRKKLIASLTETDEALSRQFKTAKRTSECTSKFIRNSGRFPLTSSGDVNTYAIFAEHACQLVCSMGRTGIIVPSGIATDKTTADFFKNIVDGQRLVSLFDFENRMKLFPIHSSFKFCLLTLTGSAAPVNVLDMAFFLHATKDLNDNERRFTLSIEDLRLLNPNTRTCPTFRSKRDAELTMRIHHNIPVLINEQRNRNLWSISVKTLFDATKDSEHFRSAELLQAKGFELKNNNFSQNSKIFLPLYEGKMIEIYNHRWNPVRANRTADEDEARLNETTRDELKDPFFFLAPRYWIDQDLVVSRISSRNFLIGYRKIARATDHRTAIFSIMPLAGVTYSINLVFFNKLDPARVAMFLANVNAIVFDYVVRQKLGGTNLAHFILEQLPVLPLTAYNDELIRLILPKVLELCYTAWDVQGFAKDLGYVDPMSNKPLPPFQWDENRRLHLQTELDAIYAHLYGMSAADIEYILDTFPIVKRNDEQKYGKYLTKELILEVLQRLRWNNHTCERVDGL